MLVEDDEADVLLVGYALEEMPTITPALIHVARVSEAEALLKINTIDVVLLDMGLPDAHGLEGFERLQRCAPQIPIILLTGFNDEARALEALQRGAEDYLIKGKTDAPLLERSMRYAIERKRNESAVLDLVREQIARQEAEAANRAKDDFLATISHELRTPLNAILGWSSLLCSGELTDEAMQQAAETIERNARVQVRLIEDLLDLSRIVTGNFTLQTASVELGDVVAITADSLQPNAQKKQIALHLDLDSTIVVEGDATRLQQIAWNLLSNAIKFTPENGTIHVSLHRGFQIAESQNEALNVEATKIETPIEYSNAKEVPSKSITDHAVLIVCDSGQGIVPEFLPHVFERFRQADSSITRRHTGLGLGLSITRNLVELHGGTIEAHSDGEDHGATFTVRLPCLSTSSNQ